MKAILRIELNQIVEGVQMLMGSSGHTDKKEKKVFLTYKEIQKGAVAKSYMTNGLLIYD